MAFCVVAISALIGINLLINTSKSSVPATQDEIASASVTATIYADKDGYDEKIINTNPDVESDTTGLSTTSPPKATKPTEKATSSGKSSISSEEDKVTDSSSSKSNSGSISSQSHYADSSSSNSNYNNSYQKPPQSSNYSSQKSSSINSKPSSSRTSSKTSSSSEIPQSSAAPKPIQTVSKPTQAVPKPTQAPVNNIYMSYSSITVSQGDVVFLSLIGASSGVSWSMNNSSILVNYGGGGNQCSFKAISKGTVVVIASYNGARYYCTVKVN